MRRAALALLCVLLPAPARAGPGAEAIREARYFEPVETAGAEAGDVALAYEGGRWREAASQSTGEGRLVFLAEGLGDPAPPEAAAGLREVRVTDPLSGAEGYVYLAHYAEADGRGAQRLPPEAAGGPEHDAAARAIRGRCYRIAFDERDPALLASLSVPAACGGTGAELLAGFHQTYTAEVRGIGMDLDYDRSRLESRVLKVWDGPVRVRRKLCYRFRLPFGGYTHESIQDADFYPYHYNYPVNLKFPAYFGMLVSALEIEYATDWRPGLGPLAFAAGGGRVRIDGAESAAEAALDGSPFVGWRLDGPAGVLLNLLRLSKSAPFEARLRYRDGPRRRPAGEEEDDSEDDPDDLRRVGFILRSKDTMGTRRWRGLSTTIFPKPGDGRGPEAFLRLLENPLLVSFDGSEPRAVDPARETKEDEEEE